MKKIKGRIISLLTVTALIATGTAPQAFAEAVKESSTSETITDYTVTEQNAKEEQAYITGEVEDLRTRYSKTYEQSDGSMVAVVSAAPIHFYDDKKEAWEEYDNRLTYNEQTENYESDENGSDMQVSLPQNIDEQNDIEVEAEGYKVSITPIDMNSSSSKKTNEKKNVKNSSEKNLKKYNLEDYVSDSVLDGKVEYTQDESSKIEYIFSGSGLKENIILSEAPEENQTYSFRIKADGLKVKLKKDNTIKLLDKDKKAVFVIPAPYMYDKNFEFSSEIKTTLKKDGTEYILTYAPDYEWLTDKDRAYPVTVDPTVSTKPYNDKVVDTSVISAAPFDLASNPNLYAGAGGNGSVKMDAYMKFTRLPNIERQWTISNAKLNLKTASDKDNKINAYKITSDWETSTVKANPPTVESTIVDVCSVPSKTDTWVYWDITNTVFDWYNGGANYGIKLSSPYAKNNQSVFYSANAADSENIPYISVEYNTISSAQLENSRTIDIGRAGTATINDFTGNLVLSREDIGVDGNRMPVNISMIYNLNDTINPTFGYGFKTNYSQKIIYTGDAGKNKYYEYVCGDGSTVYFDYDEEAGAYIDRSGRGYTLTNNGTRASDYSNIVISDSSENNYYFDQYGRLIKISSNKGTEESSIKIAYVGDYTKFYEIDYIKDSAGRKYDFNYTNEKLSDISYYGNTNTVLKKVTYLYDSSAKLTKVTYPDGKSVKYTYENQCLVAAYNTDNYHVTFNYTHYMSSSKANRVTKIIEYGSSGTKGGDISVEYTPFQTKYINNNSGDTETLVFSNKGDLISTYNSQGVVTVNEYAKSSEAHGVNSLVNTYDKTINYGYDANGNISRIGFYVYVYDEAGQLVKNLDSRNGNGIQYTYDKGGNLVSVDKLVKGAKTESIGTYTYGDANWKDLLTAYNGNKITYDEIGNPLTYYNGTKFKWTMGRILKSAVRSDGVKISYTYNADGLRTSKTINNVKFDYYWNGDKLTGQTCAGNTIYFRYDGDTPIGFEYNGVEYYYITNLQGDIIAILNDSGECVAEYEYDAWGNCTVTKDTNTIAYTNPLRYRGYYYDSDTDMYYLQSRYYDANIGRFISADAPEMIINDVLNLYSYCKNNPMNNSDNNGSWCYNIKYCAFNNQIKGKMMNRYNNNKKAMNNYYKSMIYAQHKAPVTNMGYLDSNLSNTGCEIIATYNSMKRMNKNVFLAGVILEFEMNGLCYVHSGKLGSDPYQLGSYFRAHKVKYTSWESKSYFLKLIKTGKKCGIISFWNNNGKLFWKQGIHTVAYWYDKKTKCYYLPNYNCNETTPKKYTEKGFKKMIESKKNFIIGYIFK